MFEKVDIDQENCLMFEWLKNVLQNDKISLILVPRKLDQFRIFIDGFYDENKKNTSGMINIFSNFKLIKLMKKS